MKWKLNSISWLEKTLLSPGDKKKEKLIKASINVWRSDSNKDVWRNLLELILFFQKIWSFFCLQYYFANIAHCFTTKINKSGFCFLKSEKNNSTIRMLQEKFQFPRLTSKYIHFFNIETISSKAEKIMCMIFQDCNNQCLL